MEKYGLLLIFTVLAYFTNPTGDVHRKTLKAELNEVVDTSFESGFINNIAKNIIKEYINEEIDNTVSRDSYLIFSLTKLNDEGDIKTVGFGLYSQVYIFDGLKEEVRAELR